MIFWGQKFQRKQKVSSSQYMFNKPMQKGKTLPSKFGTLELNCKSQKGSTN